MSNIEEVSGNTFDYIIVGGGTSGLTVAARLSEDPNISVLVLEAGPLNLDDPRINNPGSRSQVLGKPEYDWAFMTVPQQNANGRRIFWPRGRTLGGSSAINSFIWTKSPACDINAWERLGNPGWNWDNYLKYSQKSEGYASHPEDGPKEWKSIHEGASLGRSGPLEVSFPQFLFDGDVAFQNTLLNMGVDMAKDVFGGDPIGQAVNPMSISSKTHMRSYSASAFYAPLRNRPNYRVLCDALVHRLVFTPNEGELVATAVEFGYLGRADYKVFPKQEVIICAGALKTPQILELSGIGDITILKSLGIQINVNLPGVGTKIQDHIFTNICWEIEEKHNFATIDKLRDPVFAAEQLKLYAQGEGMFCMGISSTASLPIKNVTSEAIAQKIISSQRKSIDERASTFTPGIKEQYDVQLDILEGRSANCELISYPGYFPPQNMAATDASKKYTSVGIALNHPFSRGTIHITSSDPAAQPAIDPRYLDEDIDLQILTEAFKFARKMGEAEPLSKLIAREALPGPDCITDEDIKDYIRKNVSTTFHTVGGACMLPFEHNGVVDSKLKIYGTKNVRIADLSIVPLHFGAHSQATAYAIGEQAADIIRGNL